MPSQPAILPRVEKSTQRGNEENPLRGTETHFQPEHGWVVTPLDVAMRRIPSGGLKRVSGNEPFGRNLVLRHRGNEENPLRGTETRSAAG